MRYVTQFSVLFLLLAAFFASGVGVSEVSAQMAGVYINPDGTLSVKYFDVRPGTPGAKNLQATIAAAAKSLDRNIVRKTPLRAVSLNRLEASIIANNGILTDEMKRLAGLYRVQFVFYYPETKDIVIAGPAEGWFTNPAGRVVGLTGNRPTLRLDDLVAALRMYSPTSPAKNLVIGCSIDPTQEGLQRMQQFLAQLKPPQRPSKDFGVTVQQGLINSLGQQNVRVLGVSPKTHFARVLVEADYRMKMIGIGLETPNVRGFKSYVSLAANQSVSANALQRWFFVPDYKCVRVTAERRAMELVGQGVKLIGETEMVQQNGGRQIGGARDLASERFVAGFTRNYNKLVEAAPIWAELRNVIDFAVVARYIQKVGLYEKAGWKMELFGDEKKLPIEFSSVPKTVQTACNVVWSGNRLLTPVGGGVEIKPSKAFATENLLRDDDGKVAEAKKNVLKPDLAKGQWWWNVK